MAKDIITLPFGGVLKLINKFKNKNILIIIQTHFIIIKKYVTP